MNAEREKIAIIGSNGSVTCDILKKAHQMNLDTCCFSNSITEELLGLVDYYYNISIFNKEEIIRKCKDLNIKGVLPTTELTIPVASYITEKLGLNGNEYNVMKNVINKHWIRENNIALLQPRYFFVENTETFDFDTINLKFPLVVKPAFSGGKIGLTKVRNDIELNEAVIRATHYDKSNSGILIEECVCGKEYSVEVLSFRGRHTVIQVTEKISGGPHCVELGHSQPADISIDEYNEIKEKISTFLSSIGYSNGPSCIEIMINEDGIYLIEINSRAGGDHIATDLIPLSTGYDYIKAVINIALNSEPDKYINQNKNYCGIRFITDKTRDWLLYLERDDVEKWLYKDCINIEKIRDANGNSDTQKNYFIYSSKEKLSFL